MRSCLNIEKDGARCERTEKMSHQDQRSFRHEDGTGGIVRIASAPANLSPDVAGSAAPDARNGFLSSRVSSVLVIGVPLVEHTIAAINRPCNAPIHLQL